MFRIRQKSFESGDKAGKMLARYIKHRESSTSICAIQPPGRCLVTKSMDINAAFRDFYRNLYTSSSSSSEEGIKNFLGGLNIPFLSENQWDLLDSPITEDEISEVIKNLPTGKAPGPDGFTAEFFKMLLLRINTLIKRYV